MKFKLTQRASGCELEVEQTVDDELLLEDSMLALTRMLNVITAFNQQFPQLDEFGYRRERKKKMRARTEKERDNNMFRARLAALKKAGKL